VAATLRDVALKAGVSIKTVSNVVHGHIHVTEEKQQRVRAAIAELNYLPNLPARYLRKMPVKVIALALPDLRNPYFCDIGDAVIAAAARHAYTVLLDHTGGERANECLVVNGLRPHLIDGVILSPLALEFADLQPRQVNLPLVLLGERFFDVPYDHVAIDNVAAAHAAVKHLVDRGKRRIAAIGAQEVVSGETAHLRLRGYKEGLSEAGLAFDPRLIVHTSSFHRDDGVWAMRQLLTLDQPPDAIFCFSDLVALGAMRVLHEAGLHVPCDVAVVGFDDIEDGRYATPSLTTIAPDKERIAQLAVTFLLSRITGKRTGAPERVVVPFKLEVRESTGTKG